MKALLLPTVFKWHCPSFYMEQPKVVQIAGTFSNWELVEMNGTGANWCIIIDLPKGEYQYKFKVDDR